MNHSEPTASERPSTAFAVLLALIPSLLAGIAVGVTSGDVGYGITAGVIGLVIGVGVYLIAAHVRTGTDR